MVRFGLLIYTLFLELCFAFIPESYFVSPLVSFRELALQEEALAQNEDEVRAIMAEAFCSAQ